MRERCGARTRAGTPCPMPPVAGATRCRMHGAKAGRPPVHGRYSLAHRAGLAEKAARFLEDPAPGDLTGELALVRALLQDYLDRLGGDHQDLGAEQIQAVFGMVEQIGRTVERISRMLNATALTQADVQYLQASLADLVVRYIDDPDKRRQFLDELRTAVGPGRLAVGAARAGNGGNG
jgi:hypothetical protein